MRSQKDERHGANNTQLSFNPFKIIHEQLSRGIHVDSEEECLENAIHLRKALVFIIGQIIRNREATREFTESIKRLLDKKK